MRRQLTRISTSRTGVAVVAGLAGLTLGGAGVAVATIPNAKGVIHACYAKKTGALRVIDARKHHCTTAENKLKWSVTGPRGPQGPSGVVAVLNFDPGDTDANATTDPVFAGTPASVTVTNRRTTALVTGSIDFGATDGSVVANLEVCYQRPGRAVVAKATVRPDFTGDAGAYYAQTVTGAIGNLPPDTYAVGICTDSEAPNVVHGFGSGTVLVVQGPAPVTYP